MHLQYSKPFQGHYSTVPVTCVGTVTKSPFIGLHSTIYTNKDAVIALIDLVSHENSWVQVKDKVRVNTKDMISLGIYM